MVRVKAQSNIITTENLVIKPTDEGDAAFFHQLFNTPAWLQYIGDRNVHSVQDAATYIRERILSNQHPLPVGSYVVILKESNETVGTVGIYQRDSLDAPDIGFAFLPNYHKKGLAYEASLALLEDAQKKFELRQLYAITLEENTSSRKLLEKLGLRFSKMIQLHNENEKLMLYALHQ